MNIENVLKKSAERYYLIRNNEDYLLYRDKHYYSIRCIEDASIAERIKMLFEEIGRPRSRSGFVNQSIKWPDEIIEDHGKIWVLCELPDAIDCYISLKEYLLCGSASLKNKYMICKNVVEAAIALNDTGKQWMVLDMNDLLINPKKGDIFVNSYENLIPQGESWDFRKISPLFLHRDIITGDKQTADRKTIAYSIITWLFCFLFHIHPMYCDTRREYLINNKPLGGKAIDLIYGTGQRFCFASGSNSVEEADQSWTSTSGKIKKFFKDFYESGGNHLLEDWIAVFEQEIEKESTYDVSYAIVEGSKNSVYSAEHGFSGIEKLGMEIRLINGRYYLVCNEGKYRWRTKSGLFNNTITIGERILLNRGYGISCKEMNIKFI